MLHQFPNCYCPLTGFYYHSLRKKCPYSEFFWRVFSRIRNEYGEITSISPYSVQMRENTDQKNSEYGLFLCSVIHKATRAMSEGWPKDRRNQNSIVDIKNYLEIPNIHNIITWLQNPQIQTHIQNPEPQKYRITLSC